jgi:DNA-binding MarR family transcriptional regulator
MSWGDAVIDRSVAEQLTDVLRDFVRDARAVPSGRGPATLPSSLAGVLGVLARVGEVRVGHLAELLGVDLSVASRHTAAAIARGLVRRRPDPRDGRAGLLHLTALGEQVLAAHRRARTEWMRSLTSSWSDEDAARLLADLQRLRDDAHAARPVALRGLSAAS